MSPPLCRVTDVVDEADVVSSGCCGRSHSAVNFSELWNVDVVAQVERNETVPRRCVRGEKFGHEVMTVQSGRAGVLLRALIFMFEAKRGHIESRLIWPFPRHTRDARRSRCRGYGRLWPVLFCPIHFWPILWPILCVCVSVSLCMRTAAPDPQPPPRARPLAPDFALFSLSRLNVLSFFPLLGVFSWNLALGPPGFHTTARELQTRTIEGPGANTTKIPRETQREREKKNENGGREIGPLTLWRPSPFGAPLRFPP